MYRTRDEFRKHANTSLVDLELIIIEDRMARFDGNKEAVAHSLKIGMSTLKRKLRLVNIRRIKEIKHDARRS